MAEKIRIKDIAERAGVSVGTVDRVLHDRPNVSKPAREKVERALKEMNYQPNMYASALAYNKEYTFYLLLPKHESEAYWEEIEEGARKCEDQRRDFHINLEIKFYERSNEASFREVANEILEAKPEGVVVVPASLAVTREFTEQLHHLSIPFILLDSYMPDLRPLSFFGQDSFCSGYFAAKMLCMIAGGEKEVMLMRQTKDGQVMSKQQDNREVGFRHYMHDHFPQMQIPSRGKHLLPHRPARLHAGLLLRRHSLPGHRAEEEGQSRELHAYRAADEGERGFLSQNADLIFSKMRKVCMKYLH